MQLAYLWPAIIKGNQIEVYPMSAIVRHLDRGGIDKDSDIWEYLDVLPVELD